MPAQSDFSKIGLGATKSAALATSTSISPPTRGIHCNVAGTVTGKLEEDTADGDYVMNAGTVYSLHFKSISSIGSATGRMLF